MKCTEIAAAPLFADENGSSSRPAVETAMDSSIQVLFQPKQHSKTGKLAWDLFHNDERVGTHARVGRALVRGADGMFRPAALKLRRDEPLGMPIDPNDAYHRFWHEFGYHKSLRQDPVAEQTSQITDDTNRPNPKIVHLDEHREGDEHEYPDEMPPCVICLHAKHALPLRYNNVVLRGGADRGYERRLARTDARDDWVSLTHHKNDVLRSTLGRDPSACRQCPRREQAPDACFGHVVHVNFYINQFLMFPIWEQSLEKYLLESNHEKLLADPKEHLSRRLFMAYDIASGLSQLHQANIWHHDLNPENIVIKRMKRRWHAAIIDLGLSHDPHNATLNSDERTGSSTNLLPRRLAYAAPECRPEAVNDPIHVRAKNLKPGRAYFEILDGSYEYWLEHDPPVCVDDRLARVVTEDEPQWKSRLLVRNVTRRDGKLYLNYEGEISWNQGQIIEFVVERQRGPAADLFSFGMVVLAILLDHPKLELIRRELDRAQDVIKELAKGPEPISPFDLASALLSHPHAFSPDGRRFFYSRLARYGEYEPLAKRALGLAFSLVLRGPARSGAVTIDRRFTNAGPALDHVRELLRTLYRDAESPIPPVIETKAKEPSEAETQKPRDNASLPEDWREFLPFWRKIPWDGKPQAILHNRLKKGTLRFAIAQKDYICEFQALENAMTVIEEFLAALIQFQERRPAGFIAAIFRKRERQMSQELAEQFPAAISALDRLRRSIDIANDWVVGIQNRYLAAYDRWLKCRSHVEATNLSEDQLVSIRTYWQESLTTAYYDWEETRRERLKQFQDAFDTFQIWWPKATKPNGAKPRKMTDTHLDTAANLSKTLLHEVLPELSDNPMGPAGDIQAFWIVNNSRGETIPPRRTGDESVDDSVDRGR